MIIFMAVLLILLAVLGLSFFELSTIWMILGMLLAIASMVLLILHHFLWKDKIKEKLITGIRIGLLTLSLITLMVAGSKTVKGGYWDYQESLSAIRKAYAAGDSHKADNVLLDFLGSKATNKEASSEKKEKASKTAKNLTTEDYVREVRSGDLTDVQKDALLEIKAEYLCAQEKSNELKTVLEAMADKTSERYYDLYASWLCMEYDGLSQEETLYQELAKLYREAADHYPDNYDFMFGAGLANIQSGNYHGAEIYLESARRLTADPTMVDLARTVMLIDCGNLEKAKVFLEDVKTLASKGYGSADIQEGIREVQEMIDAAEAATK